MKNKIWKIIGIIAGALTIVAGILIMARYSGLDPYLDVAPTDFYTYLYQAAAYTAYNTLIITQVLCFGLGVLLISLGIFEICFFGIKLFGSDGDGSAPSAKRTKAKPEAEEAPAEPAAEEPEPEAPAEEDEEIVSEEVLAAERKYDEFIAKFMDKPDPEESKIPDLRKLVMDEPEIEVPAEPERPADEITDISDLKKLSFDTSDLFKTEEPAEPAQEIPAAEEAPVISEAEEAVQSADEMLAEAEAVEKEIEAALADAEDIDLEIPASEPPEAPVEEPVSDGDSIKQGPFTYDKYYKGSVDFYEY